MNLAFIAYLYSTVSNLHSVIGIGLTVLLIVGLVLSMFSPLIISEFRVSSEVVKKYIRNFLIAICVMAFIQVLTPNQENMKIIVGAYVGEKLVTETKAGEELQKLPANTLRAANAGLGKLIEMMEPKPVTAETKSK